MKFNKMPLHKQQFIKACLDQAMHDPPNKYTCYAQIQEMMKNCNVFVFTQTLKPKNTEGIPESDQQKMSAKVLEKYFFEHGYFWYKKPELTAQLNTHWHGWIWKQDFVEDTEIKQLKKYMGQRLGCIKIYRVYDIYEPYLDHDYPSHPLKGIRTTSLKYQHKYINKGFGDAYWYYNKEF